MSKPRMSNRDRPARIAGPDARWWSWRPDLSGRALARLALTGSYAALTVAIMATLANWSASGFLDRGGLDRLVQMKNTPPRPAADGQARRSGFDKGRLTSVIAATETSR